MWAQSSHMLQPLTIITYANVKLKWIDVKQKVFDKTKRILNRDTLLAYLGIGKKPDINIDASDL